MVNSSKPARTGNTARIVTVAADSADRRLDNFLLAELKGLPRTRVYRLIRKGEVRVNKGRSKPAYRLAEGDQVRIPPVHGLKDGAKTTLSPGRSAWIEERILYEDRCLLVLDKPSGLAVHGGSGISLGAIELLRAARPDAHFMELAHRLDRDTSGCLLVAKKRSSLRRMHAAFREAKVSKIYNALLAGAWEDGPREVDIPLVTDQRRNGERHVRPGEGGKRSITRFFPERFFRNAVFVRVELLTGRTHQIRAHSAAIGHPVAGDERYGSDWRPAGLKRLFLHASKLSLEHPDTGERVEFEAPLDAELTSVLQRLEAS
jgi:23S rRNA pseudouridine955/2504/2580 synthase